MFLADDYFDKVAENKENAKYFVDYYNRLCKEENNELYSRKSENLKNCNAFYLLDVYQDSLMKDIKKINLCKDKFCPNCKKVKQSLALGRYFERLSIQDNLYHLVLTVPNCPGVALKGLIKKMSNKFYYLVRYLRGQVKIKGLDLSFIGFKGLIRSLEVTYNDDSYHPHYHCLISCDCLNLDKFLINDFSYSYSVFKRYFSSLEVLIQKIWFLLINDIKVNLKNLSNLDLGYSSMLDKVDSDSIFEIFKYLVKSYDDKGSICTYEQFKVLYFSLYRVKQVQGYGIFYNMDFENLEFEIEDYYNDFIEKLQKKELPKTICDSLDNCKRDKSYKYFSKFSLYRYYNTLKGDCV